MNCAIAVERLVESARRRSGPDAAVRAHLLRCDACMERWEAERLLTSQLRQLSALGAGFRSSHASRESVMAHFDSVRAKRSPRWTWALAAAAALLLASSLFWNMVKPKPVEGPVAALESTSDMEESTEGSPEEGFMAVPFAPPLAEGEMVRMVHRELQPVELASLGVDVDPSWLAAMQANSSTGIQAGLPADVLVGADGFPRAVRLSEEPRSEGF